MTEYTISYARFLLRSWGFTRKVPMGRHVKRASRQKIAWFRKKLGPLIEERMRAGYTVCVQRLDPLLFFKPAHPAFQARFRQTACSASHSNLWFTSPHTMSLMRSYVFSGFRYLSPMIRHVLTLRIACST